MTIWGLRPDITITTYQIYLIPAVIKFFFKEFIHGAETIRFSLAICNIVFYIKLIIALASKHSIFTLCSRSIILML